MMEKIVTMAEETEFLETPSTEKLEELVESLDTLNLEIAATTARTVSDLRHLATKLREG